MNLRVGQGPLQRVDKARRECVSLHVLDAHERHPPRDGEPLVLEQIVAHMEGDGIGMNFEFVVARGAG